MLDCIDAGVDAAKQGVNSQTLAQQSSSFRQFRQFLEKGNINNDVFLDNFTSPQRQLIIAGFAHTIRENLVGRTSKTTLLGSTVSSAVSNVVQAFRQNLRPDPTRDANGTKSALITRQIKAYKEDDPASKNQACLPLSVWHRIHDDTSTPLTQAMGPLLCGALFFAMRSCEYTNTNKGDGRRRTRTLRCEDIKLFTIGREGAIIEIPKSSPIALLHSADCVSITFCTQKNGEKMETITQHRVKKGKICPVRDWANTIHRVLSYEGTSEASQVNTFLNQTTGKLVHITSSQTRHHIRYTVECMGEATLGVKAENVGTHSLRSSCAMLLYLGQVRTSTIMLLGRWKSDAFLLYLRKQVKEFTAGVSDTMVSQSGAFSTIPLGSPPETPAHIRAQHDDPMTRNHNSVASSSRSNGPGLNNTSNTTNPLTNPPAFRIWG